ncbi:lipase 3-like [Coccinella septempunctata]|uniref:lipase 3-like n=1 Tax=Coccinella septempunctata TaxID=41139 RepID=UPI001D099C48|nr:lipase 3-like [Coccinella septempunctata]
MSSLIRLFLVTYFLLLTLYFGSCSPASFKEITEPKFHPDVGLNISQLLKRHGYPFEAYTVVTEDGYMLGLHRIPFGVHNKSTESGKPVALLVHGLMSQSIDFLNNEPEHSLGLLLADQGYDVWLINLRGNTHSRRHITLDPDVDKAKFWDFSWHESGIYDLPATIDLILNTTGQSKLYYFGHSRGTTAFFVMASELPEYNQKIRLMTSLAPVTFMENNLDKDKWLLANSILGLQITAKVLNLHELMSHSDTRLKIVKTCCYEGSPCLKECELYFEKSFGDSPTEFNMTLLPVYLSNSPSGFSVKDGFHYLQQFKNGGRFRQYDYGVLKNKIKYGQSTPPEYNLTNVVAPVALHYARNDLATGYKDVEHLARVLPNCINLRMVPLEKFYHLNFIWSNHVKTLVYDEIFKDLTKY